jgi:hypothetical protein
VFQGEIQLWKQQEFKRRVKFLRVQLNSFLTEGGDPKQQAVSHNTWLKQCEVCTENRKQVDVIRGSHQSVAARLNVLSRVSSQKFGVN